MLHGQFLYWTTRLHQQTWLNSQTQTESSAPCSSPQNCVSRSAAEGHAHCLVTGKISLAAFSLPYLSLPFQYLPRSIVHQQSIVDSWNDSNKRGGTKMTKTIWISWLEHVRERKLSWSSQSWVHDDWWRSPPFIIGDLSGTTKEATIHRRWRHTTLMDSFVEASSSLLCTSNSGEARANKRVVHFSYKNINSTYNHSEKLIYLIVFNFLVGACAPTALYVASPLTSNMHHFQGRSKDFYVWHTVWSTS